MKTNFIRFLLLCAALGFVSLLQAEPVLVGNKALAGQTLDADGIKAVMLGKKITIGDARAVIIISKASDAQEVFLKDHVGMTASQFQTHWRRLFMTGGGSAPKIVENEAEALKLAAETPGAITVADSANAGALVVLSK
jgi:hypothetical protein